jgi:signal peptidase I
MEYLRKAYAFLMDTAQSLLLIFAVFLVIYIFLFRPFQVSGNSMYPNFSDKEYILTNIIALRFNKPKLGDVIVFKAPNNPEKDYVKRVIAVPGDTVMIKDGEVYVNDHILNESVYLKPNIRTYGGQFLKENVSLPIPADAYFVMGDNRSGSSDSREWGLVPFSSIIGGSMLVYWPVDKMGIIKNPFR